VILPSSLVVFYFSNCNISSVCDSADTLLTLKLEANAADDSALDFERAVGLRMLSKSPQAAAVTEEHSCQ